MSNFDENELIRRANLVNEFHAINARSGVHPSPAQKEVEDKYIIGELVTTEDFLLAMDEVSGANLPVVFTEQDWEAMLKNAVKV